MAPATPLYPLTTPRRRILLTIERWHVTHGYAPTVRDLQTVLYYATPATVYQHLKLMRRDGLVDWVDGQSRTLHLTLEGREAL